MEPSCGERRCFFREFYFERWSDIGIVGDKGHISAQIKRLEEMEDDQKQI